MRIVQFNRYREGDQGSVCVHQHTCHIDNSARVRSKFELHSTTDLEHALQRLLEMKSTLNSIAFCATGTSGSLCIGGNCLNVVALDKFKNKQLDSIFRAGATIELTDPNVAAGPEGELLLAELGLVFLGRRGGIVRANVLQKPVAGTLQNNKKTVVRSVLVAHVTPGGGISLVNNQHLHQNIINAKACSIAEKLSCIRSPIHRHALGVASEALDDALSMLDGQPDYKQLYAAACCLRTANHQMLLMACRAKNRADVRQKN